MMFQTGAVTLRRDAAEPIKQRRRIVLSAGESAMNAPRDIMTEWESAIDGAEDVPESTGPMLSDPASPIAMCRRAGVKIGGHVRLAPPRPDRSAQRLASKVVKEGVFNAMRHTPDATGASKITQSDGDVNVTVRDDRRPKRASLCRASVTDRDGCGGKVREAVGDIYAGADTDGSLTLTATFLDGNREDK